MRIIPPSELIINEDGTIFHLHLRPEQIADVVILVGDPSRVELVASYFEDVECRVENREFRTVTGYYRGRRMSVLSTGIGLGNIDISVTELDALVNVDFESRTVRLEPRQLTLLRLGTSGGLQRDIKVGDFVFARTSIGFDGVLSFYGGNDGVRSQELEREFIAHMGWRDDLTRPYAVDADPQLRELFSDSTIEGITIASPGFYAPQGRHVRVGLADESINERMEQFNVGGRRVTNYEMESSLLAGLAKLMGHRAATICTIIAQRVKEDACTDYKPFVRGMIEMALDKLATL
ncbi:MAG: nucleoside phosphorylase [Rikenellaceae bacterium]